MNVYPEDYEVRLTVAFTDLNGAPVLPSAIRAALYDGEDRLLVDFGDLPFDTELGHKEIVIPAAFNALSAGELSSPRILRVQIVTAAGIIRRPFSYLIEGEFRLALLENTFITYEAAELLARDMADTSAWDNAEPDRRQAALIEAFRRLSAIPLRFAHEDEHGRIIDEEETILISGAWDNISEEEYFGFPARFRRLLRTAQLVEAIELLAGDTTARKHRAGIVSETIGESSVRLQPGAGGAVDYGVSAQTLSHLKGYVYYSSRIFRA
ncbi:hypothetical protein [Ancylobacter rudongensis]|uniref:Uncharacterized protein n=1 Tax=Ancylobacter rudongensis TaxID=177413 RepID=A0A1G4UPT3_9HYPH|nr:hypothetical protein [Ancylobacter rudongensis]SCW95643.1 hypothetical protein SAMN05660859_0074 [Ancylobacter rudongensis]